MSERDTDLQPAGLQRRHQRRSRALARAGKPPTTWERLRGGAATAPHNLLSRVVPRRSAPVVALALTGAAIIALRGAANEETTVADPLADDSAFWSVAFAISVLAIVVSLIALVVAARQPAKRRLRLSAPERPPLRGLQQPLKWWQRIAWTAFALALVAGTFVLLGRVGRPDPAGAAGGDPSGESDAPTEPLPTELPELPQEADLTTFGAMAIALLLLLSVLLTAGAVITARKRATVAAPSAEPDPSTTPISPSAAAALQDAAERGLAAVASPANDPRAAIIACYRAMEVALTRTGAATPQDSDTPTEVLARAARGGLLRGESATSLANLFSEARFSAHPMTEGHRQAASNHLRQLLAELPDPATAGQGHGG